MYCNETKRKIIFLFIYIDSFFIYTIYSNIYLYLSFKHKHIIISQYVIISSFKQNHYIIILSLSKNHHIIFNQNHHIIFKQKIIKIIISSLSKKSSKSSYYHHQHHHIILKQNYHRNRRFTKIMMKGGS